MKKWRCKVCGFVFTGDNAPDECPQCHAKNAFVEVTEEKSGWACEHEVGSAKNLDPEIVQGLKDNFNGECSEVGMYLAMARQALREGYPEIAMLFEQIAKEEAEHAAKFAELLGEVVEADTKANIEKMLAGENGACASKLEIAKKAKELNYDAIHDAVHEMAKDEQRHGAALEAMLKRYFK